MSWQAVEAVQDHSKLTEHIALCIMYAIARHADADGVVGAHGKITSRNVEALAEKARVAKRTFLNWIPKLEESGELTVERLGGGRGKWNRYTINLPMPQNNGASDEINGASNQVNGAREAENDSYGASDSSYGASIGAPLTPNNEIAELKLMVHELTVMVHQTQLMVHDTVHNGASIGALDTDLDTEIDTDLDTEGEGKRARDPHPDAPHPQSAHENQIAGHPATVAWLESGFGWAGYDNMPLVIERLGEEPDLVALSTARRYWSLSGYRSNNLLGILDWYGELTRDPDWKPGGLRNSGNGRTTSPSPAEAKMKRSIDAIDRAFDEMEAQGLI